MTARLMLRNPSLVDSCSAQTDAYRIEAVDENGKYASALTNKHPGINKQRTKPHSRSLQAKVQKAN